MSEFSHELVAIGVQWHLSKQLLIKTNLRKQMNHLKGVKYTHKICSLDQVTFFPLIWVHVRMCTSGSSSPPRAQKGLSRNETWTSESALFRGGTVTPSGFAAQCLWARASDWKHRASVIKFLKSNKRKIYSGALIRELIGKGVALRSGKCRARSAWHSAAGLCGEDKPGERKGGISRRSFKTRSSELQICYGKKEVLIVSHPSLFAV